MTTRKGLTVGIQGEKPRFERQRIEPVEWREKKAMRIQTKSRKGKARTDQEAGGNPAGGHLTRALRRAAAACALLTLILTLGSMQACSRTEDKLAVEPTQSSAPEHAVKTVKPGSYEDWCGEHAVPESQCTRCNSSLIAAFKATGDWCAEHDLPESQCLLCNPGLKIERPPRPEGS